MKSTPTNAPSESALGAPRARSALVIGASSGIGAAIARDLAKGGWRVGLAARRVAELDAIAVEIGGASCERVDLAEPDQARDALGRLAMTLGGVDLWVLNAAVGEENPELDWDVEAHTIGVNALGFAAAANVALHHCIARGRGRIVGVSSIARLIKRPAAVSYTATKAFVSAYLDGIRELARRSPAEVTVTEACPGFVDTAMMKAPHPFWVATPEKAASQIIDAALSGRKLVYVTRRWRLVAWALALLPR